MGFQDVYSGDYQLTKGGLLIDEIGETGRGFVFIPFIFNPLTIEEEDNPNYSIKPIPGYADPWVQYISGSGFYLSFSIIVEKFRIDELLQDNILLDQPSIVNSISFGAFAGVTLSEDDLNELNIYMPNSPGLYLEQIRKLTQPRAAKREGFLKSPPNVTFLFGDSTFKGQVLEFRATKGWFTPKLQLELAEISLRMIRWNPKFSRRFSQFPYNSNDLITPIPTGREKDKLIPKGEYVNR